MRRHVLSCVLIGGAALGAAGCGAPSRANIDLRKRVQSLQTQVGQLQQQHQADQQVIAGLRSRVPGVPSLSNERLNRLFTTRGIQFARLTGAVDLDPKKPGDEGLALYVVPIDDSGQALKAAGTFDVDVFDLAEPKNPLVGHWHFDLQHAKAAWNGYLLDYSYVLTLRWQKVIPKHADLTVKVTFFDELTQTPFTAQRVVQINPPPQNSK